MRTATSIVLLLASSTASAADRAPQTVYWNGERMGDMKAAAGEVDFPYAAVLGRLRRDAEQALGRGPYTVTAKQELPPSGDKHDYMSFGPYWWPNPDTPDGLPYIRRDGRTNPDSRTSDRAALGRMTQDVQTLALAAYFLDEKRYAAHAAKLLRTWFLDADTRMNPHLQYAQAIPGRVEGRGIGIIDTRSFVHMLDAVEVLRAESHLSEGDIEGLQKWFREFLTWLRTSDHGRDERRTTNNHGSWYDAQCARYAIFVGEGGLAREIVEGARQRRIDRQIEPDGRQPRELGRTRSFGYSLFNLVALATLARAGEAVDADLWHYESADGRSLRAAIDFLVPYLAGKETWPYEELRGIRLGGADAAMLRLAADRYGDQRYAEPIDQRSRGETGSRSWLLLP